MPNVLYLWSICNARLMFWTWNDTSLATKKLQRTRTSIEMVKVVRHTSYFLHCFQLPLLSSSDPHTFWYSDILSDILLTWASDSFWHIFWHSFWHIFWHSFWHMFWHSFWHFFWHIFWHSFWHIFWHSFWHIFWQSFWHSSFWHISRLRSGTPHWTHRIAVEVRHATLNSQDRGWAPARHTGLTESQLRSGAPHWPHRIAVEVRHATLASYALGWGPARHTDHTSSQEETEEEEAEEGGGGGGQGWHKI